ncbi:probable carboxylesterase 18 [Triticum dicoccoides]|nr:probable carboxylesterase 18 [Triticum dicoccoides]XP_044455610.1 probable carboxylesterase 18 [Triticum aestivum]
MDVYFLRPEIRVGAKIFFHCFSICVVLPCAQRRKGSETKKLMAGAESARPAPPVLPWTVRLQVLALGAFCDLSQRRDGTVNRSLFSLADRQTSARPRPDALGVRSVDVVVDPARSLWARVFSPSADNAEATPLPVLVYFHGGGFALLSAASAPLDAMCRRFCRELGAVVVSVNYRRAPEHRYPAAYDDCADVLSYLATTGLPADIGVPVDLSRCFLFGDSAGGNIAHHVAHRWTSSAAASSNNPVRLAGIILLQPYFGGEERTEAELRLEGVGPVVNMRRSDWSWKAFLPEGADRNHPAAHVTGEAGPEPELPEAFPPAMVVIGGFDPLQDWQRRYPAMLRRKGKAVRVLEFPDAIHGFYMFPKLPDAGKLVKDVKNFMETTTCDH